MLQLRPLIRAGSSSLTPQLITHRGLHATAAALRMNQIIPSGFTHTIPAQHPLITPHSTNQWPFRWTNATAAKYEEEATTALRLGNDKEAHARYNTKMFLLWKRKLLKEHGKDPKDTEAFLKLISGPEAEVRMGFRDFTEEEMKKFLQLADNIDNRDTDWLRDYLGAPPWEGEREWKPTAEHTPYYQDEKNIDPINENMNELTEQTRWDTADPLLLRKWQTAKTPHHMTEGVKDNEAYAQFMQYQIFLRAMQRDEWAARNQKNAWIREFGPKIQAFEKQFFGKIITELPHQAFDKDQESPFCGPVENEFVGPGSNTWIALQQNLGCTPEDYVERPGEIAGWKKKMLADYGLALEDIPLSMVFLLDNKHVESLEDGKERLKANHQMTLDKYTVKTLEAVEEELNQQTHPRHPKQLPIGEPDPKEMWQDPLPWSPGAKLEGETDKQYAARIELERDFFTNLRYSPKRETYMLMIDKYLNTIGPSHEAVSQVRRLLRQCGLRLNPKLEADKFVIKELQDLRAKVDSQYISLSALLENDDEDKADSRDEELEVDELGPDSPGETELQLQQEGHGGVAQGRKQGETAAEEGEEEEDVWDLDESDVDIVNQLNPPQIASGADEDDNDNENADSDDSDNEDEDEEEDEDEDEDEDDDDDDVKKYQKELDDLEFGWLNDPDLTMREAEDRAEMAAEYEDIVVQNTRMDPILTDEAERDLERRKELTAKPEQIIERREEMKEIDHEQLYHLWTRRLQALPPGKHHHLWRRYNQFGQLFYDPYEFDDEEQDEFGRLYTGREEKASLAQGDTDLYNPWEEGIELDGIYDKFNCEFQPGYTLLAQDDEAMLDLIDSAGYDAAPPLRVPRGLSDTARDALYMLHRKDAARWHPRALCGFFQIPFDHVIEILKTKAIEHNIYRMEHKPVRRYIDNIPLEVQESFRWALEQEHEFWNMYLPDVFDEAELKMLRIKFGTDVKVDPEADPLNYDNLRGIAELTNEEYEEKPGAGDELFDDEMVTLKDALDDHEKLFKPRGEGRDFDFGPDVTFANFHPEYIPPTHRGPYEWIKDEEIFEGVQLQKRQDLRFLGRHERMSAMEQEQFAQTGPIGGPHPPEPPTYRLSDNVLRPAKYNWILTELSDRRNGNYAIAVRDKDGELRSPTPEEYRTVRLREKHRMQRFVYVHFNDPGGVNVLKRYPGWKIEAEMKRFDMIPASALIPHRERKPDRRLYYADRPGATSLSWAESGADTRLHAHTHGTKQNLFK
eukprot:gb/GEZN01000623.1/.p1 GENE.gb/GEZN01000623.1/~~gb/GEZN01000623.1/.p1  ORF type:complete len:1250 (-),score=279.98 gb/GEZN01000623.1/:163-3912(-)